MMMQAKSWIPEVSKDEILKRSKRIRPVLRGLFGWRWYIRLVDLWGMSFLWSPKRIWPAFNLKPLRDITTFHTYGHYILFKPSIAEVLSQIPDECLDQAVAFEIVSRPRKADDLSREHDATNAGYHVATTRLYKSAKEK